LRNQVRFADSGVARTSQRHPKLSGLARIQMPIIKDAIGRELEGEFASTRRGGIWIDAARMKLIRQHFGCAGRDPAA